MSPRVSTRHHTSPHLTTRCAFYPIRGDLCPNPRPIRGRLLTSGGGGSGGGGYGWGCPPLPPPSHFGCVLPCFGCSFPALCASLPPFPAPSPFPWAHPSRFRSISPFIFGEGMRTSPFFGSSPNFYLPPPTPPRTPYNYHNYAPQSQLGPPLINPTPKSP